MMHLLYTNSEAVPNEGIVYAINQHLQPPDFEANNTRGYFSNFHMKSDARWFRYVPLFVRLQRYIADQNRWRKNERKRRRKHKEEHHNDDDDDATLEQSDLPISPLCLSQSLRASTFASTQKRSSKVCCLTTV